MTDNLIVPTMVPAMVAPIIACRMIEEIKCDMNAGIVSEDIASWEEFEESAPSAAFVCGTAFAEAMFDADADPEVMTQYMRGAREIVDQYLAEVQRQVALQ